MIMGITYQARLTSDEPWQEVDEETFVHAGNNGFYIRRLAQLPDVMVVSKEPTGWREFIELIAKPMSEPLNSVCVYRDQASRKDAMARLREMAQNLLQEK